MGHGKPRFHAELQLWPRTPEAPRGLPVLFMAFTSQNVRVLEPEGEEVRYLDLLAPFISRDQALRPGCARVTRRH